MDEQAVEYAILSHTWSDEEVTIQEMRAEHPKLKRGYIKIEKACKQAIRDGHTWVWIDTCCIDKQSSTELSEAINSMWNYYSAAVICYVYLADVLPEAWENFARSNASVKDAMIESIRHARWFTRGWTLQELVAPRSVMFFDATWRYIGTRRSMSEAIAARTRIDEYLLRQGPQSDLSSYSIAARMAWAANRQTMRREDRAYSLLGIFDINMPLLYGEGDKAFQRLQEEIIQRTDDQSILAWDCNARDSPCAVLAPSPDCFASMSEVVRCSGGFASSQRLTKLAVDVELPIVGARDSGRQDAILNCRYKNDFTGPIALGVRSRRCGSNDERQEYLIETATGELFFAPTRIRVISHKLASGAPLERCSLQPRFSIHEHGVRLRLSPTMQPTRDSELRSSGCRYQQRRRLPV